ncbi:hypothetical protein J6590_104127 [Homalodisca vitripennis]|nr:hypothetical protein J6590_104127 [Homalodisca vitripennis]
MNTLQLNPPKWNVYQLGIKTEFIDGQGSSVSSKCLGQNSSYKGVNRDIDRPFKKVSIRVDARLLEVRE